MSDPSKRDIGIGAILRINAHFALGVLAIFYGWVCWQIADVKYWGFWLVSVLSYAGGGIQVLLGLKEVWIFVGNLRHWQRFRKLGARPKADAMAQDSDFAEGGPMS